MANIAVSSANLNSYGAGQLVDMVQAKLKASNGLEGGNSDGLIGSLDLRRGGEFPDGIGLANPGTDRARDLDIPKTYAAQQLMARKKRNNDQPRTLHTLVEYGDRYGTATGYNTLHGLARLSLALTGVAVQSARSTSNAVIIGEGRKNLEVDFQGESFDSVELIRSYDSFSKLTKPDPAYGQSSLAKGLRELSEFKARSSSDVCFVVSDFINGAELNEKQEVKSFDWEQPLRNLGELLGDRLYVLRLITPAQTELLQTSTIEANGRHISIDTGTYLKMADMYRERGTDKANRISEGLRNFRTLDLSSMDRTPFTTTADFIFGTPDEL